MRKASDENLLLVTKLNRAARVNVLVRLADGAQLHSGDDGGVTKHLELVTFSALATSIDTAELLGMQINQLSLRGHLLSFQTPTHPPHTPSPHTLPTHTPGVVQA